MDGSDKVETAPTRSVELVSPGLAKGSGFGAAYELKFKLTPQHATELEAWARDRRAAFEAESKPRAEKPPAPRVR